MCDETMREYAHKLLDVFIGGNDAVWYLSSYIKEKDKSACVIIRYQYADEEREQDILRRL